MSTTPARPAHELLYDSEATLRLVDTALASLDVPHAKGDGEPHPLGLLALMQLLERGHREITGLLSSLRQSRDLLERRAVGHLESTHARLREVTNATEIAATNVLDGLERTVGMLDALEAGAHTAQEATALRGRMRDELFALMGHMQFQDITTQQLNYASAVLTDVQDRLARVVALFDPQLFGGTAEPSHHEPSAAGATFDPAASVNDAGERQSVADEIFTQRKRA